VLYSYWYSRGRSDPWASTVTVKTVSNAVPVIGVTPTADTSGDAATVIPALATAVAPLVASVMVIVTSKPPTPRRAKGTDNVADVECASRFCVVDVDKALDAHVYDKEDDVPPLLEVASAVRVRLWLAEKRVV